MCLPHKVRNACYVKTGLFGRGGGSQSGGDCSRASANWFWCLNSDECLPSEMEWNMQGHGSYALSQGRALWGSWKGGCTFGQRPHWLLESEVVHAEHTRTDLLIQPENWEQTAQSMDAFPPPPLNLTQWTAQDSPHETINPSSWGLSDLSRRFQWFFDLWAETEV